MDRDPAPRRPPHPLEARVSRLVIPPTLRNYLIPETVINQTREFLRERGEEGLEAVVLWLGEVVDDENASILAAYVPEQIGHRTEYGVAVEVTQQGLTRLIS